MPVFPVFSDKKGTLTYLLVANWLSVHTYFSVFPTTDIFVNGSKRSEGVGASRHGPSADVCNDPV